MGGGINGAGIARDAAGRGLKVLLAERGDLAAGTSSASSKLVHGGLRYLEQFEWRLVAEALREREVLLRIAPHLVIPMRFVMPHVPGVRPAWMIRAGLFLYDWLARRQTLPASVAVDLQGSPFGAGLEPHYRRAYAYSDCWVDDARLVIANARAAANLGAEIVTRSTCLAAAREGNLWRAKLLRHGIEEVEVRARAIVNATGVHAAQFLGQCLGPSTPPLRFVQGSHIVVRRIYEGEHAFVLQNVDRRIVFVYPYEGDYTLIGTTEVELVGEASSCQATAGEVDYLCRAVNRYFTRQIGAADVVWSYCGVRALVDDGSATPSGLSRDYVLRLDTAAGAPPLLSVLGGKITTYRRLAEHALDKLRSWFPALGPSWTANAALPGGDVSDLEASCRMLSARYPWLLPNTLSTLARRHGSLVPAVLGAARNMEDMGAAFGADLYGREVDFFLECEWASEAEDVLWRRTKAGLHLSAEQEARLSAYVNERKRGMR